MVGATSIKLVLTGFFLVLGSLVNPAESKTPLSTGDSATITVADLPVQGSQTYELITRGGPFPYEKDGGVFGNRERLLPLKTRGYYREYTVRTPGLPHRGTRRIVCGGESRKPEACYYTADHYASFRRIVP